MARMVKLPEGVSVRGRSRSGGRTAWSVRYRAGGKDCEQSLQATTKADAYREARDLTSDILQRRLDALDEAVDAGVDPELLALIQTIRRVVDPARAIKPLRDYIDRCAKARVAEVEAARGPKVGATWIEARDEFIAERTASGMRSGTAENYLITLAQAAELLGAEGESMSLSAMSPSRLRDLASAFAKHKTAAGWSEATLAKTRRQLMRFLRWVRRRGYLGVDMTDAAIGDAWEPVTHRPPPPDPVPLGAPVRKLVEASLLCDAARPSRPRVYPLMLMMLLTGCRRDEARLATWQELSADLALWSLPQRTKTGKARYVDLTICPSLISVLRKMKLASGGRPHAYIFPGVKRGRPWAARTVTKAIKRLEKWGAPPCTPQRLRQTAATALINWPVVGHVAAAGRLGHSPPTAWKHYNKPRSLALVGDTLEQVLGIADLDVGLSGVEQQLQGAAQPA